MPAPWHATFGATEKSFRGSPAGPRDSGPLGAERGIITKVKVDVTLERALGVERGPATTAHVVALVQALPRELNARPVITIRVSAVEFSRHRNEAQSAETFLTELDKAGAITATGSCPAGHVTTAVTTRSRGINGNSKQAQPNTSPRNSGYRRLPGAQARLSGSAAAQHLDPRQTADCHDQHKLTQPAPGQ